MGHVNVNISLLFCCLTTGAEKYARKKRLIVNSAVSKYDINECREERRKQNRCKLNRKPAVFSCNEKDKAKSSPSNTRLFSIGYKLVKFPQFMASILFSWRSDLCTVIKANHYVDHIRCTRQCLVSFTETIRLKGEKQKTPITSEHQITVVRVRINMSVH